MERALLSASRRLRFVGRALAWAPRQPQVADIALGSSGGRHGARLAAVPAAARAVSSVTTPVTEDSRRAETLVASGTTVPAKLAGAIARRFREKADVVSVAAMGPAACYAALRAVAVAGEYLREDRPGEELLISPERESRGAASDSLFEMRLDVRCMAKVDVAVPEVTVNVAQKTNVGNVASFVARALLEAEADQSKKGFPAFRTMGGPAASQALKAALIAKGYLSQDDGRELALVPRLEKRYVDAVAGAEPSDVVGDSGAPRSGGGGNGSGSAGGAPAKRVELVMRCCRVPSLSGSVA